MIYTNMLRRFLTTNIQIFAASFAVCAAVTAGALYFWFHLVEIGDTYTAQVQLVADTKEQERVVGTLEDTLTASEADRAALEDYFLDVVQVAQFLETVEQFAEQQRIIMSSNDLYTTEPNDLDIATVHIPYEVHGPPDAVQRFVEMMETLPYHSELRSLRIRYERDDRMAAELEVAISYITYD